MHIEIVGWYKAFVMGQQIVLNCLGSEARLFTDLFKGTVEPMSDSQVSSYLEQETWYGEVHGNNVYKPLHTFQAIEKEAVRAVAQRCSELLECEVSVSKYARNRYVFKDGKLIREFLDPGYIEIPSDWV